MLVQLSIIIFVAGSVLAGLSTSIPMLLTARAVQGIAMGGLMALAQSIIGTIIPPRERGRYSGYMGAVMAVATAGGPLLGGFIVDSPLGWRWTFFVCVPLAVIALILLQKTLKLTHVKTPAKIDWLGSVLLTAGVSLLLIWVSFAGQAGYYDWWSWQSVPNGRRQHCAAGPAGAGGIQGFPADHSAEDHLPTHHGPGHPGLRRGRRCDVSLPPPTWVSTTRWHVVPAPPRPVCSRSR